jgi:hypothetical protein
MMADTKFIDEISSKIKSLIASSPAGDLEKNLHALLQSGFAKLDLVSREEFDAQTHVLLRAREQLDAMERKLAELEARITNKE